MGIGDRALVQGQREHRQQRRHERRREELRKLDISMKYGADTVMDLSTGGDIDVIRAAILEHSPCPSGPCRFTRC